MSSDNFHKAPIVRSVTYIKTVIAILAAAAAGIVIGGVNGRIQDKKNLTTTTLDRAIPTVSVLSSDRKPDIEQLVLPGTLQAYYSAPIYARVNGYLKRWLLDIGTPVKAGQLLAEIETPDMDQDLKQAIAVLETTRANEKLAEITSRRWNNLLLSDSVSAQEADEKNGDYAAKKTIVAAAQANVDRLRALESFKRITTPFDGVVISRNTDVGALINAGQQAGRELFTVADIHKLRLYVSVPQSYANRIKPGMTAQLDVPEYPGQHFSARMVSNANAVNEASGTVLIQLEVDNAQRALLPGEYASVTFSVEGNAQSIHIPPSALVLRKDGSYIATVNESQHVTFHRINITHDFGTSIEIASALPLIDPIIDTPPDSLIDGDLVRLKPPATSASAATPQRRP
jgi:RND family efflux transporter MFP subunit